MPRDIIDNYFEKLFASILTDPQCLGRRAWDGHIKIDVQNGAIEE